MAFDRTALHAAAWRTAFDQHVAHLRRSSYAAPTTLLPPSRGASPDVALRPWIIVVVCPPWRYDTATFAHDVRRRLAAARRGAASPVAVVALPPPFVHAEGGREWFGYATEDVGSTTRDDAPLMHRLALEERADAEVGASMAAVDAFLHSLSARAAADTLVLFGSSQGASVAAHVGVRTAAPRLSRVVAFQPAGFYVAHWHVRRPFAVRVAPGTHGDLATWDGRVGRRPGATTQLRSRRRSSNGSEVALLFGADDSVAPPALLSVIGASPSHRRYRGAGAVRASAVRTPPRPR